MVLNNQTPTVGQLLYCQKRSAKSQRNKFNVKSSIECQTCRFRNKCMNYDFLFAGIAVYSNERDLIATYYRALMSLCFNQVFIVK